MPLCVLLCAAVLAGCGGGAGGSVDAPGTNSGDGGSASATLSWTASSLNEVTGYRVYYGTSSGSYRQARGAGLSAGSAASYAVQGLKSGTRYYFVVTAYDAAGNESGYSAEVSKLVQ